MRSTWPAWLLIAVSLAGPAGAHPDLDQQIRDLTARLETNPGDATLLMRRGELHRIHMDWKRAEADYRAALRADPDLAAVHLCRGKMKLEAGRPAEALKALRSYLRRHPGEPRALGLEARALGELGRHLAAAESYTRALERGRPEPEYYLGRARALEAAGPEHLDRAIAGLDEGIARLGNAPTLQVVAIDLELRRGRPAAALARLDRVAEGAARKDPWLLRRGEILESAGRLEEARAAYAEVVRLVEELPASRRGSRAVQRVADEARAGLARLRPDPAPAKPATGKVE